MFRRSRWMCGATPKAFRTGPLRPEQSFLKRQAEVTQQDHEQFSEYLQEKSARDRQRSCATSRCTPGRAVEDQSAQHAEMGRRHRGGRRDRRARLHDGHRPGRAGARRHAQRRHLGRGPAPSHRARADQPAGGRPRQAVRQLGRCCCRPSWAAAPTRSTSTPNRVLASIWYWNYGDYNPISPSPLRLPECRPVSMASNSSTARRAARTR